MEANKLMMEVNLDVYKENALNKKSESTMLLIISMIDVWQEAKSNWINVKAFNKARIERPEIPSKNAARLEKILETVFLSKNLNSEKSIDNDRGQRMNGFFAQHLLVVHEMYCNVCFTHKSEETDWHNHKDSKLYDSKMSNKGTQTTTKIPTINISGKMLRPRKFLPALKTRVNKAVNCAVKNCNKTNNKLKVTRNVVKSESVKPKIQLILTRRSARNLQKASEKEDENSCQSSSVNTDINESNDTNDDKLCSINNRSSLNDKTEVNSECDVDYPGSPASNSDNDTDDEKSKHYSSKRYEFKCNLCDKAYARPGVLKVHIDTHHMGKKFKCDICKREYTQAATLRYHMAVHTDGPKDCSECGKRFMTVQNLKFHVKNHHTPKNEVCKCEICGNIFSSKLSLKNHAVVHLETKNFCCDICGKAFKRKTGLMSHLAIHTGKKSYSCDLCDATFGHSSLVYKHKKKKHGERDQLCNVCGKAFFTVELLNRHTRTHSEEPHFNCRECGKAYRSETAYRIHLNTHKGILPKPQNRRPRKKPPINQEKNKQTVTANSRSCMFSTEQVPAGIVREPQRENIANQASFIPPHTHPHPSYVHYEYDDYRYF